MHNPALKLTTIVSMLLGLAAALASLLLWYRLHINIPERDTIPMIPLILPALESGMSAVSFSQWIHPHFGSHRIGLVRVLLTADFHFAHGLNYVIYLTSLVSVLSVLAVNLLARHRSVHRGTVNGFFYAGLLALILFSPSQIWNFIQPIGVSWFLCVAMMNLGIWCLLANREKLSPLLICLGFSICALASMANFAGVVALLFVPVIVFVRSRNLFPVALITCLGWIWLYMRGIERPYSTIADSAEHAGMLAASIESKGLITHYLDLAFEPIHATLTFLTAPFSSVFPSAAIVVALGSVALVALLWFKVLFGGAALEDADRWTVLCLIMATTCIGIGLVIYFGRQGFPYLPHPPRYRTIVMFYWVNVCSLVLISAGNTVWKRVLAGYCALALGLGYLVFPTDVMSDIVRSSQVAAKNISIGVLGIKPKENPKNPFLPPELARLSAHHETLLSLEMGYGYIGKSMQSLNLKKPDTLCSGATLELRKPFRQGLYHVNMTVEDARFGLARRVFLFSGPQLVGALYPNLLPAASQYAVLMTPQKRWRGFLTGNQFDELTVLAEGLGWTASPCEIAVRRRSSHHNSRAEER